MPEGERKKLKMEKRQKNIQLKSSEDRKEETETTEHIKRTLLLNIKIQLQEQCKKMEVQIQHKT